MAKKKKMAHGGAREGAGRPPVDPKGRTRNLAITVPGELADKLDAYATKMGLTRSKAATEAIRGLLGEKH